MDKCTPSNEDISRIIEVVWGREYNVENEIGNTFEQWSQGFIFSDDEPCALVQEKGGPCAVIAPIQAYIIRYLFLER